MVKRFAFRAQYQEGRKEEILRYLESKSCTLKELAASDKIMTLSVFMWNNNLFLYYESIGEDIAPEELFGESGVYLKAWPGEADARYWVPMYDIFHYNRPVSIEHWRRKQKPEKIVGRLARLKPEMLSSYIYYHYQYQEEKPCDGNKTGIIHLNENVMFFYHEEPVNIEPPLYQGGLNTSNTPSAWGEVMGPHFIVWEDAPKGQEIWRNVDLVFHMPTLDE